MSEPGLMVLVNTVNGGNSDELVALIDELSAEYCVDAKRIHVMGTSWSGGMAERLACQHSERIASFVSALSDNVPVGVCSPTRPVPLLTFTGDTDRPGISKLVDR